MLEFLCAACRVGRLGMPFSESVHSDKIFHVEKGPIFPFTEHPVSRFGKLDCSVFPLRGGRSRRCGLRESVMAQVGVGVRLTQQGQLGQFSQKIDVCVLHTSVFEISTSRCWSSCALHTELVAQACHSRS